MAVAWDTEFEYVAGSMVVASFDYFVSIELEQDFD